MPNLTLQPKTFDEILLLLPEIREKIQAIREIILANLVMISEIPAPTFKEQERVEFLKSRFSEYGLLDCSTDDMENIYTILPGKKGDKNMLVVAHLDTVYDDDVDHTVSVQPDSITGPAVADNSLGVASIISLPSMLEYLNLQLQANLIIMGTTRSLGRGNLGGLRFFLTNTEKKIDAGICVEGIPLGRFNHQSIGMLRGEIRCVVPEGYDWTLFGASGAIFTLNEIITRIVEIPTPTRPLTNIVLGSIAGGSTFNKVAMHAQLQFEIRSESSDIVEHIRDRIEEITVEVGSQTHTDVDVDFFAKRSTGGLPFSHPLCRHTRKIMEALEIAPKIAPSIAELSMFIERGIPAITLGISTGETLENDAELVHIQPMFTGLTQLVGLLLAIDGGFCYENR